MRVLEFSIKNLKFVGLCTESFTPNTNEFLKTFRSYLYVLGFFSLLIVGSGLFIIRNYSDVEASTNALEVFAGGVECLGAFVSFGLSMKVAKDLHAKIQALTDKGNQKLHCKICLYFICHLLQPKILRLTNITKKPKKRSQLICEICRYLCMFIILYQHLS